MRLLEGKNAVITGARRGIGRATVEIFAQHGANIWACIRKPDELFENDMALLANKYNVRISVICFDLQESKQITDGFKSIRASKEKVDILCNVAGVNTDYRRFQMISRDDYRNVMEANLFGHIELTQMISRLMMTNKSGSIINVSSIAGTDGFFASCDYVASKAAIIGATKQQARELGKFNIRVNHVSPGVTDTDMLNHEQGEQLNSILPAIALGRFAQKEEIAKAILFLASDLATYITGQELRVDGGATSPRAMW